MVKVEVEVEVEVEANLFFFVFHIDRRREHDVKRDQYSKLATVNSI